MHLCSLSITYACPYHHPTATMGHSIHNVDISKPLTHTMGLTHKLSFFKPIVAAYVRVAGLRWSWRWRCWMWRFWAGVVTRGLRLWGRLDVLPNSLKRLWRRLMVEKGTLNSRATALVDIPAVSMPIARSLKTCDICGFVLCNKTAHFRVVFYCGQPKRHLCNNHAV